MSTDTNSVERLMTDTDTMMCEAQMMDFCNNHVWAKKVRLLCIERDAATARVAELERLVRIGDVRCEQCADPATTIDSAGDAACAACAAKKEN